MTLGDGAQPGVDQGPLINEDAVVKVEGLLAEAQSQGARVLLGGHRHALGGSFFEPTVITGVTPNMAIFNDEIFGPVASLTRFETEAEAVALANATPYGLAAYFYASDLSRVFRVAEQLEYGMIGVNEGLISTEVAPFGGVKQSGLGREGSQYGLDEYLELKYLLIGL
jgi:succinate-semialdehyde dehydrogenase/glutarate-semialdehyde dehydrogenase